MRLQVSATLATQSMTRMPMNSISVLLVLPGWDSYPDVKKFQNGVTIAALVFFGLLALCEIAEVFWDEHRTRRQFTVAICGVSFFAFAILFEYFSYRYESRKEDMHEALESSTMDVAIKAINGHLAQLDQRTGTGGTSNLSSEQISQIRQSLEDERTALQKTSQVHVNIISAHELAPPETNAIKMWLVNNSAGPAKVPINQLIWVQVVNGTDSDMVFTSAGGRIRNPSGAWTELWNIDPDWGALYMGSEQKAAVVHLDSSLLTQMIKPLAAHAVIEGCLLFRTQSGEVTSPASAFEAWLKSDSGKLYRSTVEASQSSRSGLIFSTNGPAGPGFRKSNIIITSQSDDISKIPIRLRDIRR
jgi:hypothetical protein